MNPSLFAILAPRNFDIPIPFFWHIFGGLIVLSDFLGYFMHQSLKKSNSLSKIPLEFEGLKKSLIDGTAPRNLISRFQIKVISLSGEEAIQEVLKEISQERKDQKRKRLQFSAVLVGLFFLVVGSILTMFLLKNKKSGSQELPIEMGFKAKTEIASPKVLDKVVVPNLLPDKINFCGELVPVEDRKISRKLRFEMVRTRISRAQTMRLRSRANKWFPIITPILKQYRIPEDFKYIPLVETGFANSVSHKGAGGFWQLMEGTARHYGLKVNDSTDQRNDVRLCTIAACKYIRDLHRELASWTLTAAAYNMGPGGLRNKVDGQNNRDYYRLKLNSETSVYVYKTLAFKQMLSPRKKKSERVSG